MKYLIASIIAVCSLNTNAKCVSNDKWTGYDKKMHFIAGATISAAGTLVFKDAYKGFMLGAAAAVAKEVYDSTGAGNCSAQDLAVTLVGAALGAGGSKLVLTRHSITYTTEF